MQTKTRHGKAHERPTELPATVAHWYFHKTGPKRGLPMSQCKRCVNWDKLKRRDMNHGKVPVIKVRPLVQELVEMCGGIVEASRVSEISRNALRYILDGDVEQVQKHTAHRVMVAFRKARKQLKQDFDGELNQRHNDRLKEAMTHQERMLHEVYENAKDVCG